MAVSVMMFNVFVLMRREVEMVGMMMTFNSYVEDWWQEVFVLEETQGICNPKLPQSNHLQSRPKYILQRINICCETIILCGERIVFFRLPHVFP